MTTKKAPGKAKSASKVTGKRVSSRAQKRVLARAEGSQCFWVHEGPILADLVEFRDALALMEPHTFDYHVSDARNDFADWIEFVLGDTELAHELRGVAKPKKAHAVVVKRLKIYDLP